MPDLPTEFEILVIPIFPVTSAKTDTRSSLGFFEHVITVCLQFYSKLHQHDRCYGVPAILLLSCTSMIAGNNIIFIAEMLHT
jgi:hypothetical protein